MNATTAAVTVRRIEPTDAPQTAALLDGLRVSLFGVQSRRLYDSLVFDGIARRIDCRVAVAADGVCGLVLAAPRLYWIAAPLIHWGVALDCARARFGEPRDAHAAPPSNPGTIASGVFDGGAPRRTWHDPADAWRIIVVGTASAARGRGVAAELYRALMRDRSLVARIAADNYASIRLHRSVGWRLYPDGEVVLAVHERGR